MPAETPVPFITSGSYPTRAGNAVRLLIDGEPAFRRVCEAIENAQHSVWVTFTFMWPEFRMPEGRGTPLEVLNRAARRGIDVCVIPWRPDEETASHWRNAFRGAPEHFETLRTLDFGGNIRWDRAQPGFCQHQKTWLIDVGKAGETAFLGGINLNPNSLVAPGHSGGGGNHDVYIELTGPAVVDCHHNFVQRWNEASEREANDGRWGAAADADLPFPTQLPEARGAATVQIQRTIHTGRYTDGTPAVNGEHFNIAGGERSNVQQYLKAIASARRSIYIETQYLEVIEIVMALETALKRGVEIVLLMPAVPDISPQAYASPERHTFFEARAALGAHDNFTLAGIAGLGADGRRKPVYIHSKPMLIDDHWATVGSTNLHRFSLFGNAELNAAISSPETVRAFRVALLEEHLGLNTTAIDDLEALRLFKKIARSNLEKLLADDHDWQGLAFALDISSYGKVPQIGL
jgi:cardiolipin synthase A/B